jgi:hypothetical protein
MHAGLIAKLTIGVCLLTAVVQTILGCTSAARLMPKDAILVLLETGPYLLLALFAWWQYGRRAASWALLAIALGLSVLGLYAGGVDSYRYHTEWQYRMTERYAPIVVALLQWAVVPVAGLGLLVCRPWSRRRQPAGSGEPTDTRQVADSPAVADRSLPPPV